MKPGQVGHCVCVERAQDVGREYKKNNRIIITANVIKGGKLF